MKDLSVSIIVPVFNDAKGVAATIESIEPQLRRDDELIIVDNNSTDNTPEVISNYSDISVRVKLRYETEIQSSYAARNNGIKSSSGSILAFVDSNMTVNDCWLDNLRDVFNNEEKEYIGYNVEQYTPNGVDTFIGRYNMAKGFPVKYYLEQRNFAPTCCLAIRRRIIDDVGLFNENLISGGDAEFGQRVANAGYAQEFIEGITIYHPARTSLAELKSKAIRVGRGSEQLYKLGKKSSRPIYDPRNILPPHPSTFRQTVFGDHTQSTIMIWYLIDYWFKIYQLRGRIYEKLGR